MEQHLANDEISLKELIKSLVANWKYVVFFPFVFGVVAFVYFWIIANPIYEARIEGLIDIPTTVETQFGTYTFPENTANDIIAFATSDRVVEEWLLAIKDVDNIEEASIEKAKARIDVKKDEKSNQFTLKLTAKSPEIAKSQLKELAHIFMDEVNLRYKIMALGYFSTQLNSTILLAENEKEELKEQLVSFEAIIGTIEPVISLKRLMLSNPVYASQVAKERGIPQELLTDEMMMEEIANPNYQTVEMQIIESKQRIGVINVQNKLNKKHLGDIQIEEDAILKRLSGDQSIVLRDDFLNVASKRIVLKDKVSGSKEPVAPPKVLLLAAAIVLGSIIGVVVALFVAYWKRDDIR